MTQPQQTPVRPRRHLLRKILFWVGPVLVVAAFLVWWRWPTPIPVDVARVTRGDLQVTLDEDARIHIRRHTTVAAPISGRVLASSLRAGDSVSRGGVVATMIAASIDPRMNAEYSARVRAAEALVAAARAQVAAAQLAVDDAHRARLRADALIAQGAISPRDHEQTMTLESTRQQELKAARDRVSAAESDAAGARAALLDAHPGATTHATPVSVYAPMTGRILRIYEEHDRTVVAGTPLLDIGDLSDIEIIADVLSTDASAIRPGDIMIIHLNDTAMAVRGRITAIEPAAFTKLSPLGVEEQRVNVRAVPIDRFPPVGDEYQVDVAIVLWEGKQVVQMPTSALVSDGTSWSVYRLQGNTVRRRSVTIGHRGAQSVEILKGLAQGDRVVLYPSDRISDGVRVCTGTPCR